MEFVRVASATEISQGTMKKVNVNGKDVLVVNANGKFFALNNICPHQGGSLADGTLTDGVVSCPKHGAQFDVKTGEVVGDAKIAFFKIKPKNAGCYEVKINGTDVMVGVE